MNKEVKDLIQPYNPNVKKGTWYVTSGTRDIKKPYLIARLEELEAENKLLKKKVNQLESTLNEVRKECETNIRIFDSGKSYSIAIKDVSKDILKILGKRGKSNE